MGKKILTLFGILVVSLVFFFHRASLPHQLESSYTEVFEYKSLINNDLSDTLSIVTYNIGFLSGMANNEPVQTEEGFYAGNQANAVTLFQEIKPSIMGFQEIDFASKRSYYYNQLDSLGHKLGFGYGAKSVNWDKGYVPFPYWPPAVHYGKMLSGQGVLSRFPILSNERIVLERPDNPWYYDRFYIDRLIQVVHLDLGEDTLVVMNIHLEAWNEETRRNQAKVVLDTYREYVQDHPVILLGDFNDEPAYDPMEGEAPSIMELFENEPRMTSAITKEEYMVSPDQYHTFDSSEPVYMIDYIFYSDQIQKISSRVLNEAGTISDHLPVYLEFVITDGSEN